MVQRVLQGDPERFGDHRHPGSRWIRTGRSGYPEIRHAKELCVEKAEKEDDGRATATGARDEREAHHAGLRFSIHLQVDTDRVYVDKMQLSCFFL